MLKRQIYVLCSALLSFRFEEITVLSHRSSEYFILDILSRPGSSLILHVWDVTKLSPSSHIISISFLYQRLQYTFHTMVLMRLLALSLFIASLASSQHTNPAGVKSNSDTDNLSFPWSRLRLPR